MDAVAQMKPFRQSKLPRFSQVFHDMLQAVVKADRLTRTDLRVWLYLIGSTTWGNWSYVSQAWIAQALQVDTSNVCKAVATLIGDGLLEREWRAETRSWRYRIPSKFAHYGPLTRRDDPLHQARLAQLAAQWSEDDTPHVTPDLLHFHDATSTNGHRQKDAP